MMGLYMDIKLIIIIPFITHMLHGAGIFTNMCPKNDPVLQVNIPAPWFAYGYHLVMTNIAMERSTHF
jgi:hypothetical protein